MNTRTPHPWLLALGLLAAGLLSAATVASQTLPLPPQSGPAPLVSPTPTDPNAVLFFQYINYGGVSVQWTGSDFTCANSGPALGGNPSSFVGGQNLASVITWPGGNCSGTGTTWAGTPGQNLYVPDAGYVIVSFEVSHWGGSTPTLTPTRTPQPVPPPLQQGQVRLWDLAGYAGRYITLSTHCGDASCWTTLQGSEASAIQVGPNTHAKLYQFFDFQPPESPEIVGDIPDLAQLGPSWDNWDNRAASVYFWVVTPTATPTATPAPCGVFSDVAADSPFYNYIRCLVCRGVVSGYNDSTFRPGANVTRGQLAKFVANAANYQDAIPSSQQTFSDVPPGSPFWFYVERAALHGVISGYSTSPPCTTGTPCFLPTADVTRGQTAKFVTNAGGFSDPIPSTQQTFTDMPSSNAFWVYVERAYLHGVISGYTSSPPCTTGAPCFLPGNAVTRGQTSKFIANAFFPNCQTP